MGILTSGENLDNELEQENYTSASSDESTIHMDKFAVYCHNELNSHSSHSDNNLEAINSVKEHITGSVQSMLESGSVSIQLEKLRVILEDKFSRQKEINELKTELHCLTIKEVKMKKDIQQLKSKLKDSEREMAALQSVKTSSRHNYKTIVAVCKKAKKYYNKYYNINVSVDSSLNSDLYTYTLYFEDANQYPIDFLIDRKRRCIVNFDAKSLLSREAKDKLINRYKETENTLALLARLRNLVLEATKHTH